VAHAVEALEAGHEAEDSRGIELAAARGAEVRAVPLRDQLGDAEVLGVSDLGGLTVVLLYAASQPAPYLMLLGPLEEISPVTQTGAKLPPGTVIGRVAGGQQPGLVHLDVEVRKLRQAVDPHAEPLEKLRSSALSLPTDPRNVLRLRK
jgi:hypothetical protein